MLFDGNAKPHPAFELSQEDIWENEGPWFRWGEPSDGSGVYDRNNAEENREGSDVETIAAVATWCFAREVGAFAGRLYQVRIA